MEIKQADEEVYKNMQELSDELPDNSPRYILLSYPLTLVCISAIQGRRREGWTDGSYRHREGYQCLT
jgi:hypothetical protein